MRKFIIKSNEWYDSLPDLKRLLFFLLFVAGGTFAAQYFITSQKLLDVYPIWVSIKYFCLCVCFWCIGWCIGYSLIRWWDWRKEGRS